MEATPQLRLSGKLGLSLLSLSLQSWKWHISTHKEGWLLDQVKIPGSFLSLPTQITCGRRRTVGHSLTMPNRLSNVMICHKRLGEARPFLWFLLLYMHTPTQQTTRVLSLTRSFPNWAEEANKWWWIWGHTTSQTVFSWVVLLSLLLAKLLIVRSMDWTLSLWIWRRYSTCWCMWKRSYPPFLECDTNLPGRGSLWTERTHCD